MKSIYYKIWADCIHKATSLPSNQKNWKVYTTIFMSMAMALNLALIIAIFQRNVIRSVFYEVKVDIFPGTKLDSFLSFFLLYLIIPILINYFLIFRRNRYEKLLTKYQSYNGKLFISYFLASLILPASILIVSQLF